jgi:general secretion pathway protein F
VTSFAYQAADSTGRVVRGRLTASDPAGVRLELERRGLLPVAVREASPRLLREGPSRAELATMFQSLAGLVDVGVPIDKAARATGDLIRSELGERVTEVGRLLATGMSLSTALVEAGIRVPAAALGILRAGEAGSQLGYGLSEAASLLERDAEAVAKVRQALAYPAVLLVTGLASVTLIMGLVVPRFAALLEDLGQTPPLTTRLLLGAAALVREFGLTLLIVMPMLLAATVVWARSASGRDRLDRIVLRLPLAGSLVMQFISGRTTAALGAMLAAGMPLLVALDVARQAVANREVERRLDRARSRVSRGERLHESLEAEAVFTDQCLRLIAIGEANGRLAEMTRRAAALSRADSERRLKSVTSLLEPLLILVFALGIGLVAIALLQAVYSLRPGTTV